MIWTPALKTCWLHCARFLEFIVKICVSSKMRYRFFCGKSLEPALEALRKPSGSPQSDLFSKQVLRYLIKWVMIITLIKGEGS